MCGAIIPWDMRRKAISYGRAPRCCQLFDPSEMAVDLSVGEPDGAALVPGATAVVHLDAFPELSFTAHFDSASPVATSPLGTSVKTFAARFRLDQSDPRILPDLSAALDIEAPKGIARR